MILPQNFRLSEHSHVRRVPSVASLRVRLKHCTWNVCAVCPAGDRSLSLQSHSPVPAVVSNIFNTACEVFSRLVRITARCYLPHSVRIAVVSRRPRFAAPRRALPTSSHPQLPHRRHWSLTGAGAGAAVRRCLRSPVLVPLLSLGRRVVASEGSGDRSGSFSIAVATQAAGGPQLHTTFLTDGGHVRGGSDARAVATDFKWR